MGQTKAEVLQGTLDLMVLKILDAMGAMHGYGIALESSKSVVRMSCI
jgi:PadR family transcriptional regulator PadR